MGCLSALLERIGGSHAVLERVTSTVTVLFKRVFGISVAFERAGGSSVSCRRVGGVNCRMGLVCGTSIGDFEVLWVQDGPLLTIDDGYLITEK